MDEKLSQNEIDALIDSFKSGNSDELEKIQRKEEYRLYDFNRPEKFSVENLRSLQRIADVFAKNLTQTFTARLRVPIKVEFYEILQVPFVTEYVNIMPKDNYAFCVIDLGIESLHEIILELDLAFILVCHKRWLGGEFSKKLDERRPLGDYEQITLKKLLEGLIFDNLERAFDSVTKISPSLVSMQTDSQMLKVTSPTDIAAVVTFKISCDFWETTLKMVIPYESVEEIISKLTIENLMEFSPNKKNNSYKEEVEKGLKNVLSVIYVNVGETTMTLRELSELKEGDVIRFDNKITEPVKGYAANVHKFYCIAGRKNKKRAFRFLRFANTEENR